MAIRFYVRVGEYPEALLLLTPLGEKGNPDAAFALALLYQNGRGVRADSAAAAKWYRVAADQGVDGIDDHPFGKAAHFRNQPGKLLQITVERLGGMFRGHFLFSSTEPAGDVVLGAPVVL